MISRFNQLLLAFTTVTPLLLSIAAVSVCLYPSGYGCAWSDLVCFGTIPMSIYWWIPTVFISMFMASWIWTGWLLKQIMKERRGELSITLSSLQNTSSNNLLPVIAMLPPWVTLLQRSSGIGSNSHRIAFYCNCILCVKARIYKFDFSYVWL